MNSATDPTLQLPLDRPLTASHTASHTASLAASYITPVTASIIINNYNYGRFLASAIESALAQSYPCVEVIVVDDGSSDDSRARMAVYGDRIVPVLKENGGQASAFNAGFARSRGSVVIFLDADDLLHPTLVERVVAVFQTDARVVRVQYRLAVIDADGVPTGQFKPPMPRAIPCGDLRQPLLRYGDDIAWLPTSGNAFSAALLRRILPVPEAPYRICADYYLSNLSPLFGQVAALAEAGGSYRVHGANHHEKEQLDLEQIRQMIIRTGQTHAYVAEYAQQLGLTYLYVNHNSQEVSSVAMSFIANRLVSLRLAPARHPLTGETRWGLVGRGLRACRQRVDLPLLLRLLYGAWFLLVAILPKKAARWLAEQLLAPQASISRWQRWLTSLRRARPSPISAARGGNRLP